AKCGYESEQDAGEDRDAERVGKNAEIEVEPETGVFERRRANRPQRAYSALREQQAEHASAYRENDAFKQKLAYQLPPARAESEAQRDFLGAAGGAYQLQAGDIGACDQQHQARDDQQNGSGPVVDAAVFLAQCGFGNWRQFDAASAVFARV